jgi:hypothetical protein
MYLDDQAKLDWAMVPKAQGKLAVGIALAAGFVVLMNLLAGTGPSPLGQLQPNEVAQRLQLAAR